MSSSATHLEAAVKKDPGPQYDKLSRGKPGQGKKTNHKRTKREKGHFAGTNEDVLKADIEDLLKAHGITGAGSNSSRLEGNVRDQPANGEDNNENKHPLPEPFTEADVKVEIISSTGDGLGFTEAKDHVYVVPFTVPGDKVRVKVIKHFHDDRYSMADFVQVIEAGPKRDDSLVKCPYFSKCSGCQFQMMSSQEQLAHKKSIVAKAYKNFSGLTPESIPPVQDTMPSPLEYGYRTKLSPHFDGPPNARKDKRAGIKPKFTEVPAIGYNIKGTRKVLDIEDCPLGTDTLRAGLKAERERIKEELDRYSLGATLLLRESTERLDSKDPDTDEVITQEIKSCVTDSKRGISKEYVADYLFVNSANAFFQNNNSILPRFVEYVKSLVTSPFSSDSEKPITHLIDAYCGSGLFTICLSSLGLSSTGIDISEDSIRSARENARLNNLPDDRTLFKAADAVAIFADLQCPPDQTVVVIDPPRKGCDHSFLNQLLLFGPKRLVYVSCNVHTQARDVAFLVEGKRIGEGEAQSTVRYQLKSLRGLDFFPQTGHVEGVALLDRA